MNPILQPIQPVQDQGEVGQLVHMMLTQASLDAENTKRAIVEIELRATEVGPILEGILREAHGTVHWGLNE